MPSINHLLSFPWFELDSGKDLRLLYLMQMLRVFVDKYALFFVPIFLFQLGFSWQGDTPAWLPAWLAGLSGLQLGMVVVAGFYGALRLTMMFLLPLCAHLLTTVGNRLTMVVAYGFFALTIISLNFAQDIPRLLFMAIISYAGFEAFVITSERMIMASNSLRSRLGKDISVSQFVIQLANMVAPLMGGAVIVYLGYQTLFMSSLILVMGLVIAATHLSGRSYRTELSFKTASPLLTNIDFQRMIVSTLGRYMVLVALLFWPIYLYLLLGGVDRVGYLYSASFFMAMLFSLAAGVNIDGQKTRRPFFGSAGVVATLWVSRIFIYNPFTIAFVDALDRLAGNYHWLFYDTLLFKAGKVRNTLLFFVTREIVLSFLAVCLYVIIAALFIFLIDGWQSLFVLAAVGVLLSLLLNGKIGYDNDQ